MGTGHQESGRLRGLTQEITVLQCVNTPIRPGGERASRLDAPSREYVLDHLSCERLFAKEHLSNLVLT